MQKQANLIYIKRKTFFCLAVTLFALIAVTPALADYLGPDRTKTETSSVCKVILYECQYVDSKDTWKYKSENSWPCSSESKPWQAYPSNSHTCTDSVHDAGYQYWEREDVTQTVTNTYPPATIDSALQNCTSQNGWCVTPPQLFLNGIEPVAGYGIIAIEGSLNGQNFACMSPSCSLPLNQGSNDFTYWALSSFGDSSTMGTLTASVDSQLPNISGTVAGVSGSNGWYLSPATFNGLAADLTSGLASFTCTLDGVPLGSCDTIPVNGEGSHALVLNARDNAGLTRTLAQTVSIDTQPPTLNASLSGTQGSHTWYTAATLNASASDVSPGSGLSAFEYKFDSNGWTTFPASGVLDLAEGKHSVDLRAVDQAGHTVSSSKDFWLDRIAPRVTVNPAGTVGANNWYVTNLAVAASASDDTSGMDSLEYSLDNNDWKTYTSSLILKDGVHTLSFWAQDEAGLVKQVDRTYQVDTQSPQIAGSLSGILGLNGWFTSDVTLSASASDPILGSGLDTFTYILNNSPETPYTDPLALSDGHHTIQFTARDYAGLSYFIEQDLRIDTTHPSLEIETQLPQWVKGTFTLSGISEDEGSGLSKVEISTDGGQAWQAGAGPDEWSYVWNTLDFPNGINRLDVRVTDLAGLTTQRTLNIGVDNHLPEINLPDSWFQWDTVPLDVWDKDSGLSKVSVEISDPAGRWPKRIIELNPQQFPLGLKWDRRFGDDSIAEAGTYDVKVTASDLLGNTTTRSASIYILLDILPPGPTTTPQSYPSAQATLTPTPTVTATSVSHPRATQTAIVSVFGKIEPTLQVTATPVFLPTTRSTPTQMSILDQWQSIFQPDPKEESIVEIGSVDESNEAPQPISTDHQSVLWGTAATAAIGAAIAYAQEEKRKREQEKARQEALEAAEEERREKAKERHMEKMEEKRAQEQAWEEAREEQEAKRDSHVQIDMKMDRIEVQEAERRIVAQIEARKQAEEKKRQEEEKKFLAAEKKKDDEFVSVMSIQGEKENSDTQTNWWEKTKAWVNEKIIQPLAPAIEKTQEFIANESEWVNEIVLQPLKPALERTKEFIASESAWIDEYIYQPLKPAIERTKGFITNESEWINEHIFQPVIKPIAVVAEKTKEFVNTQMTRINEEIYQPYIKPVVAVIDEKIYQPYVKPIVEPIIESSKELIVSDVAWLTETIYQPIFEPIVKDINQYIYIPVSNWWDQYGEWVHGALDAAGVIPGLGDVADGINAVIYLTEGRYLEAGISAISMLPILGDLGKAGKWAVEAGQEVVDKAMKEIAGDLIQKAAKESLEQMAEKELKKVGTELVENAWVHETLNLAGCIPGVSPTTTKIDTFIHLVEGHYLEASVSAMSMVPVVGSLVPIGQKVIENSFERLVKETTEELSQKIAKESLEKGEKILAKEVEEEIVAKVAKESSEELVTESIKETGKELVEKVTKETLEESAEKVFKEVGEDVAEKTTREVFEETVDSALERAQTKLNENAFIEKVTNNNNDGETKLDTNSTVAYAITEVSSKQNTEETIVLTPEKVSVETTKRVLKEITEGKVTKLPTDIAEHLTTEGANELAEKISEELGGKKVWVSAKTGSVYVSNPPAEGFLLAEQLSKTDLTKTDEVEKILHRVAEITSRGSGNHAVLGPFKPNGTFIQEALDTDGIFWDVGDELWEALDKTGIDMFKANDQFLRVQIENRIESIDIVHTDVNKVINDFNNNPSKDWTKIKYTEKEILDIASMPDIPYQLVNNSWIRSDLVNSMK